MKTILGKGKWLQLISRDTWEYVERVKGSDVAVIFAIDGDHVIFIEQYRAALDKKIIELPAGLVGDETDGEEILKAAHRELLEETGYEAKEMIYVSAGPPSSGITSEVITLFIAKGLKKVGPGGGDATENITVHRVALAEVEAFTARKMKDGCLIDPKIYGALYFAMKEMGKA